MIPTKRGSAIVVGERGYSGKIKYIFLLIKILKKSPINSCKTKNSGTKNGGDM